MGPQDKWYRGYLNLTIYFSVHEGLYGPVTCTVTETWNNGHRVLATVRGLGAGASAGLARLCPV